MSTQLILRIIAPLLCFCACVCVLRVAATDGGDISEYYDAATFQCCRNNGWDFVIVRSYHSYGAVDTNAPLTLHQAIDAGMPYHDVYHFPCATQDAQLQMSNDLNGVRGLFGMLWFDIETNYSPGCGWSADTASNCNVLSNLIAAGHNLGIHMGIYSSAYMWESIMGSCTAGADNGIPLWYAHYDGTRSFSDFSPFGGWTKPNAKQYNDAVGFCGINADADWYPS